MYFAFFWMDRWLQIMEALTAEQARLVESDDASQATLEGELDNLRRALADSEQALLASLSVRQQLETSLASQREAAGQRQRDYVREISELRQAAAEAEQRIQAERKEVARSQADVERLHRELTVARGDVERIRGELAAVKAEGEQLRSALENMHAETTATRNESTRLEAQITEARAEAEVARNNQQSDLAGPTRRAAEAEEQRQIEQREKAEARREIEKLRADLQKAEAERASARQAGDRVQRALTEVRARTESERKKPEQALVQPSQKYVGAERESQVNQHQPGTEEQRKRPRLRKKAKTYEPLNTDEPVAAEVTLAERRTVPVEDLVVRFRKPDDWSGNVYVYYWDTDPAIDSPEWPGAPMAERPDGWLVHALPGVRAAHLIFSDDKGHRTDDLQRDHPGWLAENGTWHDHEPQAVA